MRQSRHTLAILVKQMVESNSRLPPRFRGLPPCEYSRHQYIYWYIPSRLNKLLHFDPPTSYNKDSSIASDESLWILKAKFILFWHATQPRWSNNMKSCQFWGAADQEKLYGWLNGPTNQSNGAWSECGRKEYSMEPLAEHSRWIISQTLGVLDESYATFCR